MVNRYSNRIYPTESKNVNLNLSNITFESNSNQNLVIRLDNNVIRSSTV
jgi:hypothetical protein